MVWNMSNDVSVGSVHWSGRLPATLPRRIKTAAVLRGQSVGEYLDELVARDESRFAGAAHPLDTRSNR